MVFKKFHLKIHYIMTCCYMNIPDCSWQVRLHTLTRMYTHKGIVENRIKTLYMIKRIISPLVLGMEIPQNRTYVIARDHFP